MLVRLLARAGWDSGNVALGGMVTHSDGDPSVCPLNRTDQRPEGSSLSD